MAGGKKLDHQLCLCYRLRPPGGWHSRPNHPFSPNRPFPQTYPPNVCDYFSLAYPLCSAWVVQTGVRLYAILLKLLVMQGSSGSGEGRCEAHELRLYPLSESTYNGQYYNVSFCTCRADRPPPRRPPKTPRPANHLTFPRFNRDRNFSTPAFILNSERNYYESEGAKMRAEHERKMMDYTEEKLQIHVAKPRSKNNYCSVCKSSYEDYLEHIHSEQHARRIRHSPFERDIQELAGRYLREHRRKRTPSVAGNSNLPTHNPPVLDKNTSTRYEDSDEVEIISNPYKMRKPSHEVVHPNVSQQLAQMNYQGMFMGGFEGRQVERAPAPFKPFSTTYQEQMSQCVLNLNIFLNPYPVGPLLPSPLFQAKQQELSMLQYSFFAQMQMQQQLQLQQLSNCPPPLRVLPHPALQAALSPPAPHPSLSRGATFIVIDE